MGDVCQVPEVDARQIWEDWGAGYPGPRWSIQNDDGMAPTAESAAWGGRLLATPDAGRSGFATLSLRSSPCLVLTGKAVTVRVVPVQGPFEYTTLIIESANPAFGSTGVQVEKLANGNLDVNTFGPNSDSATVTYDPEAHAWWRVQHDASTGVLSVMVADFCDEDWTTLASANVGDTWDGHEVVLAFTLDEPNGAESPGSWSEIYISDTNPEPES